ncbi:MAG: beta-lactamase family protein [Thermomicrobiales bacterium]|nr:beta-lactamase family protein [Thermomicrobiales bacterium]MCO5225390.1 beta-lactamase family protein [Thermomicrobiales bacterium]MCO5227303.1 beta-lactamase family protein [Thermomicrobiales bacterium]
MAETFAISGTTAPGFERVRECFAHVASDEPGLSAQLSVYHRGEQVIDLWTGPDVTGESLMAVYSVTKGAAYLVAALLMQDGLIDPDAQVTTYWPELLAGQNRSLTVRDLLMHKAGLISIDSGFRLDQIGDDARLAHLLETQQPFWEPGTAHGYHAFVIGALVGEIVRRVTGKSLQSIYEESVRRPHDIEFYLGLPETEHSRFLTVEPSLDPQPETEVEYPPMLAIAMNMHAPEPTPLEELPNLPQFRVSGQSSGGGIGSARGLARMYAAAIGLEGGTPLLGEGIIDEICAVKTSGTDVVLGIEFPFMLGYLDLAARFPSLDGRAFGHDGANGSLGFADARNEIAYGYTRRRFRAGNGSENEALINEVIDCIRAR